MCGQVGVHSLGAASILHPYSFLHAGMCMRVYMHVFICGHAFIVGVHVRRWANGDETMRPGDMQDEPSGAAEGQLQEEV